MSIQDKTIADAYGNKFIIPLDFEMLDSGDPITKEASRTDYITKLLSTITTESSNHQKLMPRIRSQTYPQNMRLLLNPTSRDLSGLNTKVWPCCMTELSGIDKFQ